MKAVFTVIQNQHLPHAKILEQSLKKSNPSLDFVLCLVDEFIENSFGFSKVISVEDLEIAAFTQMKERYTAQELLASTKPYFAEKLLKTYSEILFFDAQSEIVGNLNPKFDLLVASNMVLVPQILKARQFVDEKQILNAGMFTATCFGLKRSPETEKILAWWQSKMPEKAHLDPEKGFWLDQIWLNHIPIFFKDIHVDKTGQLSAGLWVKSESDEILSHCYARADVYPKSYLSQLKNLDYKRFKAFIPKYGRSVPIKSPVRLAIANGIRSIGYWFESLVGKLADLIYN